MQGVRFTKVHGLGNDYVLFDRLDRDANIPDAAFTAEAIQRICDRRLGVGADGVLILEPAGTRAADARLWIINRDGSPGGVCGTGTRCAAAHLVRHHQRPIDQPVTLIVGDADDPRTTHAWVHKTSDGWRGSVDMGTVSFEPAALHAEETHLQTSTQNHHAVHHAAITRKGQSLAVAGVLVSVGNPHFVCFLDHADAALNFEDINWVGEALNQHAAFPRGINVHLVKLDDRQARGLPTVRIVTCERGAGVVAACTTGACAVAAACNRLGLITGAALIASPGGQLLVTYDAAIGRVSAEGEAVESFQGVWPAEIGRADAPEIADTLSHARPRPDH